MKRRGIVLLAALATTAAGGSSPWWGPPLLRELPGFGAERVEVSGTRLLAPHEVLAASGIRLGQSVWTDPAAWEAALRSHPVVAGAEVTRRLPSTLHVRVTEKRPAALLSGGVLRPATAAGEILPVDPARVPVDLPILRSPARERAGRVADSATLALLAETARIASLDPALAARVSEVAAGRNGTTTLLLSSPAAEVVLPAGAGGDRLRLLRAALADVARRAPADSARGLARLDLRFADQVVVRLP